MVKARQMVELTRDVLAIDESREVHRISDTLRTILRLQLRRRGLVVAISGGVDSAVCAALGVQAVGAEKVIGLLLPERDSSPDSLRLGEMVCRHLGIRYHIEDIAPTLEAIGCYHARDEAIRRVFPEYDGTWPHKLAIRGGIEGRINHFALVVRRPDGNLAEERLPHTEYLQIVAATNFKQRVRKNLEYFHADRLNYAVVGTPNRLEFDQGFFVRNGDGAADVKPIAHLYKTQVYALARFLGLPREVLDAIPTTDTYSLEQGQEEFFFGLPLEQLDLALWAFDHGAAAEELARALRIETPLAERIYRDIEAKRRTTAPLHAPALLMEPIEGVGQLAPHPRSGENPVAGGSPVSGRPGRPGTGLPGS